MPGFAMTNLNKSASIEKGLPAPSSSASRPNVISALMLAGSLGLGILASALTANPLGVILGAFVGVIAAMSPRVAKTNGRGFLSSNRFAN